MALVEIRQLELDYGAEPVLRGVDLTVEAGQIVALLGPSGCGKTSLLRVIAGFEVPRAGTVRIDGEWMVGPTTWVEPEKRRIGMVFQQGALFPHLTVWQNVGYGLRGAARDTATQAALELVGMSAYRNRFPDELSGGEQQRVALARALAPRPRLVLLDEPFASLDAALRRRLREDLRTILAAAKITAVLVTHDQEEALSVAETVSVMLDGKICQSGSPGEIYARPATVAVAQFLGDSQLVPCEVSAGQATSALGTTACSAPDGPGWMLIRPEDLTLLPVATPAAARTGSRGWLRRRNFYGHDHLDEIELADGTLLQVRVLSPDALTIGEELQVALRSKTFWVYPRGAAGLVSGSAANPTSDRSKREASPSVLPAASRSMAVG